MSLHPIRALNHVIDEYRDYLLSEFRARDGALRRALMDALDEPLFLAQEPFYQAHRPFRTGARWDALPLAPALARAVVERTGKETAFLHQSEGIGHLLGAEASPLVVTTGTGSGKTECFLLPVIENAARDAAMFAKRGLTAVLVYPMNALANDQLLRIDSYLEKAGLAGAVKVAKYDRGTSQREREQLRENPPHILLTNYMMLEYLLVRPSDRDAIFANHRCRFLVLDEVHSYRGALGSNIALLIRRLRAHLARAGQEWRAEVAEAERPARYPRLLCVGTSATIKSSSDVVVSAEERRRERDTAVREFFGRLTGEEEGRIRVVSEELEEIQVPANATLAPEAPSIPGEDTHDEESLRVALCALAGISASTPLTEAARRCRLLWLLNRWLAAVPMSLGQIVARVRGEVPERASVGETDVRREVETALLAGAALPDDMPGALRLRAHRFIRGGWKFFRCVDPACGRLYPMGEERCTCGRHTAPLHLCRNCGADYLQIHGDPDNGPLQPGRGDDGEWMLYDERRQSVMGATGEAESDEDAEPAPRQRAPRRVQQVRNVQVRDGSFDVGSLTFSQNAADYPLRVRLVPGRTRCVCCGGTAGSRTVITPVQLGTSAAVKVLGEGLVEALAEANANREGHDGKERLLIFSDSRQDAAHQARFIIFASRYDRMRRRLLELIGEHGPLGIQRAVELLGEIGVRQHDNPHVPDGEVNWLPASELERIRGWEEAPLLDELAVTAFYRGTLVNLGVLAVRYEGLDELVAGPGVALCERWHISQPQLAHLLRCFLDECRVRSMMSREMLRIHPQFSGCPEYIAKANWERKVKRPRALPANRQGRPAVHSNEVEVPDGVDVRNVWRREGAGGRGPSFQRIMEFLLERFGGVEPGPDDAATLLAALENGRLLIPAEVAGFRERARFFQLNHEAVCLFCPTESQRMRCNVCGWPLAGAFASAPCPRCDGSAVLWSDAEVNEHRTVRRLSQPHYIPLNAQEHTAQVTTARRVEIEEQFKARQSESPLNILACSPTMEMGIDVGGLDAVVMRNVPPRPDNYAQRGGRAGRRTRVGLVVGYARSTPHDQYFYDHPGEMISGEIPAPALSLTNRDVVLRHLAAIAFGQAQPGLAGRMVEYISPTGQIEEAAVGALLDALRATFNETIELARAAWGEELFAGCRLNSTMLREHLDSLPERVRDLMDRTARQVIELRQSFDRWHETLAPGQRRAGSRAADLVARLLGIADNRRTRNEAEDTSAGYPLRRFAEFGILPGYEFPSEPASLRLLNDPNEEDPVNAARRFGIYQFMPGAPVYARARRWKVIGLDNASPWNPRSDVPWHYRSCARCTLRFGTDEPRCRRCGNADVAASLAGFEFGGFLAKANEAPVLDEEDRIAQRNLVQCYPQWNGEVLERWTVGPGWSLALRRNEEVRWMNEGLPPTQADRDRGVLLHNDAKGFLLCPNCGRQLSLPDDDGATPRSGRRRPRGAGGENARDPYGHGEQCPSTGQPPQPSAIVCMQKAEVLRIVAILPSGMPEEDVFTWGHSLGAALRAGIRHVYFLDWNELEFALEGPWTEAHAMGEYQKMCLTFIDPTVGGSGYLPRIARELDRVAARAIEHLDHPNCETACYRCLKSYQNQRQHDHLNWPRIIGDLEQLAATPTQSASLELGDSDDPRPWLEAYAAGVGSPLELRFSRLFEEHGFSPQKQVPISVVPGAPAITIADFAVSERRLAIYVDGAAFHVGARLRRDHFIRRQLRECTPPWHVVELTARDLSRGSQLVDQLRDA